MRHQSIIGDKGLYLADTLNFSYLHKENQVVYLKDFKNGFFVTYRIEILVDQGTKKFKKARVEAYKYTYIS